MVGSMLHRKLLRDIRSTWGRFLAVAAVAMCAVVVFVSFRTTYYSLQLSRDVYYAQHRFADFFVTLEKAPESALRDVEAIPGVWRVRGRIVKDVPLHVPGNDGAVVGRVISMPLQRRGLINDIHIVSGSYFPGAAAEEVIVNERFCEANRLKIGDTFEATVNERRETLRVVGTAYSPEYVYALRSPQQFGPDDRNFAIVFARESFVEDAFDMTNAFNDVVGLLRPDADVDDVLDRIKERLDSYGVYQKYARKDQLSNNYLDQEMVQLRNSALVLPLIFLLIASQVINILIRRMTELQRTQIGLLCALGYSKARIALHYCTYAVAIGVLGAAVGTVIGFWLASAFTEMYNAFFRFPSLEARFRLDVVAAAFGLSAGVCAAGAVRSAWRVLKLQPALAIRPQAPSTGPPVHRSALAGLWAHVPLMWRIAIRTTLRSKGRAAFTIVGVAVSTVILILGMSSSDMFDYIIDYQFGKVDVADTHLDFRIERPLSAVHEVSKVQGVRRAEGIFQFGADVMNDWRKKTVLVMGLPADSRLYIVRDQHGRPVRLPDDGLIIPERLARIMALRRGDNLLLDPYLRDIDERPARVAAVVKQYLGLTVFATRDYLNQVMGQARTVNGALVLAHPGQLAAATDELNDVPAIIAITNTRAVLRGLQETTADMSRVSTGVLTMFAGIIAFAVVYNSASVTIAEQARDLACLRGLGYDSEDVASIGTNSIMPLGLLGALLGLPLGNLMWHGLARAWETDLYRLPVVIRARTYIVAAGLVLVFQLIARWACRRRIYRLDIVRTLKSRE